ncbi:hypothetical protein [Embleya sp. MST-111070]|uniref:hypothetical protein n=1 Tax=Embleya sp. MST-111070 TaxID=3398231 RepID=UPI003F73A657
MILRVDAGWVLDIQTANNPVNLPLTDWGSFAFCVERHRYERFRGELYYEETAARAATFVHSMIVLEPFADFNAVVGCACADRYMAGSDEPLTVPPGGWVQLTRDIRERKHTLTDVARTLRAWSRPHTD